MHTLKHLHFKKLKLINSEFFFLHLQTFFRTSQYLIKFLIFIMTFRMISWEKLLIGSQGFQSSISLSLFLFNCLNSFQSLSKFNILSSKNLLVTMSIPLRFVITTLIPISGHPFLLHSSSFLFMRTDSAFAILAFSRWTASISVLIVDKISVSTSLMALSNCNLIAGLLSLSNSNLK